MAAPKLGMERQRLLATEKIGRLMLKMAIPTVISQLVSSIYNIVDQIFIGNRIGFLGNAATTVAFPVVTLCTAIALLCGIGGAANFNLRMGRGDAEGAAHCAGNSLSGLVVLGLLLMSAVRIWPDPLLHAFGATAENYAYASEYLSVTACGIPFLIMSTGGGLLVRADGSPRYSMIGTLSGALLNVGLDAWFIYGLDWGMRGAALATVIGQAVSGLIIAAYFFRFKSVQLTLPLLKPAWKYFGSNCALGIASFLNQIALTAVNITLNNTMRYYGALSVYGSDIPISCVGVCSKLNSILIAFAVGVAQGCQPIHGFNYGAGNYARVRETYKRAAVAVTVINLLCFLSFQLFPRQIIGIFGSGSELYYQFAERYLRVYMMMTLVNGLHPITGNFFSAIGKPIKGAFISLTRQFIFLLPLLLLLPRLFGIDGVFYAGPAADLIAFILIIVIVSHEFRQLHRLEDEQEAQAQAAAAEKAAEAPGAAGRE